MSHIAPVKNTHHDVAGIYQTVEHFCGDFFCRVADPERNLVTVEEVQTFYFRKSNGSRNEYQTEKLNVMMSSQLMCKTE